MCHSRNDADSTKFIIIGCIDNDANTARVQARTFADTTKFTADGSKNSSRHVHTSRRRVDTFTPTRPYFQPTHPRFPANATISFWTLRLARVGYAADATRNHRKFCFELSDIKMSFTAFSIKFLAQRHVCQRHVTMFMKATASKVLPKFLSELNTKSDGNVREKLNDMDGTRPIKYKLCMKKDVQYKTTLTKHYRRH